MPWHKLDAFTAHATLDQAKGTGHGWAAKARQLHAQLVPPSLDLDPLATVEHLVNGNRASGTGGTDVGNPGL